MSSYFVEKTELLNGDHEVHIDGCHHMPMETNRTYVGEFNHCIEAIEEAKSIYPTANGCFSCCETGHSVFG
ncbi:MAG: hypothetical protein R3F41_07720 [Gammaproteobacteria bacterium]|nr:hypothetical protein [Pseudomonadales bacterium]MCP5349310.1 hypothetical protein [Pseudomonadales bacterium]